MKDYVILVDSCCDLSKEFRNKHNIEYVLDYYTRFRVERVQLAA